MGNIKYPSQKQGKGVGVTVDHQHRLQQAGPGNQHQRAVAVAEPEQRGQSEESRRFCAGGCGYPFEIERQRQQAVRSNQGKQLVYREEKSHGIYKAR